MKQSKILIYLAGSLLVTVFLGGKIYRPRLIPPILRQLVSDPSPAPTRRLETAPIVNAEIEHELVDPFRLLSEELVTRIVTTAPTFTPVPKASPRQTTPPYYPKDSYLRGILLGKVPQALVEEQGNYHQVGLGDNFAGGVIIEITTTEVSLRRDQRIVRFKLGE